MSAYGACRQRSLAGGEMFSKPASIFLPCALLLLPTIYVFAQSQTTGRMAGTIRDPNGAVIVGAEVTITSVTTGEQRKVTTNTDGNYTVPLLSPGIYRVKVTANGLTGHSLGGSSTRVRCQSCRSRRGTSHRFWRSHRVHRWLFLITPRWAATLKTFRSMAHV
jgi:hypothetical protein